MKSKTINAIICKKFDNFLKSITDKEVQDILALNTIITGGSIVSMLVNENVNDFDLYLRTKESAAAVARYYVNKFKENPPVTFKNSDGNMKVEMYVEEEPRVKIIIKSAGIAGSAGSNSYQYFEQIPDSESAQMEADNYVEGAIQNTTELDDIPAKAAEEAESERYKPLYITSNAITLNTKVQIVIRFYGEPEEIHKNYDFEHCTNYWTSWDRHLELRQPALESILAKELRYRGSLYPICSVIRTRKFLSRGWTINAGQYLKMCWQIAKLDLTNIAVLEDQLIGVDAAYFGRLIEAFKQTDMKTVDSNYVCSIIDKIF